EGGTRQVPIELVQLTLQSVTPFIVTTGGMNPQPWNLVLGLSDFVTSGPPPLGSASITRTGSSNGGTWNSTLPVKPVLIFQGPAFVPNQSLPLTSASATGGTWTTIAGSSTQALVQTGLPLGVALTGTFSGNTTFGMLALAVVDSNTQLLHGASLAASAVVGASSTVGMACQIGASAQIGARCMIGDNVVIGAGCVIGPDVHVGLSCTFAANLRIDSGATL